MDSRMDGWTDGQKDRCMDKRVDRWTDGSLLNRRKRYYHIHQKVTTRIFKSLIATWMGGWKNKRLDSWMGINDTKSSLLLAFSLTLTLTVTVTVTLTLLTSIPYSVLSSLYCTPLMSAAYAYSFNASFTNSTYKCVITQRTGS